MKRAFTDPNLRVAVIAGIISSVVVIIIVQPLLTLTWRAVLAGTSVVNASITDTIYSNAARGHEDATGILMMWATLLAIAALQFVNPSHRLDRIDAFVLTAFFASAMIFLLLVAGISETASSFRQRLSILAPSISDETRKELEAQWASMRTRSDYQQLTSKMEQIATQNHIKLPPTRP